MQDGLAITVAIIAGIWLASTLTRRFFAPPCQPPSAGPAGSDGFVSLETLGRSAKKNRGDPKVAPIVER